MTFDGRKITTLVMLALFLVVLVMAYSLPPKAAFMPYLVGIPGALLCLLQLVIDIRQSGQDKPMSNTEKAAKASEGAPEAQMFIWLAIFTGALIGFG